MTQIVRCIVGAKIWCDLHTITTDHVIYMEDQLMRRTDTRCRTQNVELCLVYSILFTELYSTACKIKKVDRSLYNHNFVNVKNLSAMNIKVVSSPSYGCHSGLVGTTVTVCIKEALLTIHRFLM